MTGILRRIEAGLLSRPFYDHAHGNFVEANRPHAPVAIDDAKQRSFRDPAAGFQAGSARTGQVDGVDP